MRRVRGKYSVEQDATMARELAAGRTCAEVSSIMGLTRNAVIGRVYRLKMAKPKAQPTPVKVTRPTVACKATVAAPCRAVRANSATPERIALLRAMSAAGEPRAAIAAQLGVSKWTITQHRKRFDIAMPARPAEPASPSITRGEREAAFEPVHDRHPDLAALDTARCCKWPLNGPDGGMVFCSEAKSADAIQRTRPYCDTHARMAVTTRVVMANGVRPGVTRCP